MGQPDNSANDLLSTLEKEELLTRMIDDVLKSSMVANDFVSRKSILTKIWRAIPLVFPNHGDFLVVCDETNNPLSIVEEGSIVATVYFQLDKLDPTYPQLIISRKIEEIPKQFRKFRIVKNNT